MNPLKEEVVQAVAGGLAALGAGEFDPAPLVEVPPSPQMGDYAFPCFQLAKRLRKAPQAIAAELSARLRPGGLIERIEVAGAYVNFFLSPAEAARRVIEGALRAGKGYGGGGAGRGKTVVIEYSSPNIAKPFHVGHLRSTVLGHSLARIAEALGYETVRLNHLGDWGTQFGKLIVAYRKWGDPKRLEKEPIKELLDLYVRFHDEAERSPELEEEARAAFRALEEGGEEETRLWSWFRELSLEEFQRHYDRLGVRFDSYLGESAYGEKMKEVLDRLEELGLVTESDGALVVELGDLPPCLIRKRDGATLYATRDLAAAVDRHQKYGFDRLLYVVGAPQSLHFQQVFAVLRRMGYDWVDRCEHVAFGHVRLGDLQFSTRKGNVIFLEDLLDEAVRRARAIIEERNPSLEGKDAVAEMVGLGAAVFDHLAHNRIKDISFDWETALNFDGDTAPYLQYTHARAASVLRRGIEAGIWAEGGPPEPADFAGLREAEELQLVKAVAEFPEVVAAAFESREPSVIARYLLVLAQEFNSYYHAHRIVGSDAAPARLSLVASVKLVIGNGLFLLGIAAPEAM